MYDYRIIDRFDKASGSWERVNMQDLKAGDIFKMREPNDGSVVGNCTWLATKDAKFDGFPTAQAVWGIEAEKYKDI